MSDATAHLDALFASNPAITFAVAVSVELRAVIAERSRNETAGSPTTGRVAAMPAPELVREYVDLAVTCAAPFSKDLEAPRPRDEWTVLRFETAQWSIAAFREGGQADTPRRQWILVVFVDASVDAGA